jgi:DNA replication protein DnaC
MLYRELFKFSSKLMYRKFPALIKLKRQGIDGEQELEKFFDLVSQAKFIIIDEIGRESKQGNSDFKHDILYEIIDRCYMKKYVIFISNMNSAEIHEYLDGWAMSRLSDDAGYCEFVEDNSKKDLRKPKWKTSKI